MFRHPGWYRMQLKEGPEITLKVLGTDDEVITGTYQGQIVEAPRQLVERLQSLQSAWDAAEGGSLPLEPQAASEVRDAIEDIASLDRDIYLPAHTILTRYFPACRAIVHKAVRHRDERVRQWLVKLLGEHGVFEEDHRFAADLLTDPSRHVRFSAVRALESFGQKSSDDLIGFLSAELDANLRKAAVSALASWNDPTVVGPLVVFMQREFDRSVRTKCAVALSSLLGVNYGDDPLAWKDHVMRLQQSARKKVELLEGQGLVERQRQLEEQWRLETERAQAAAETREPTGEAEE